ncbi:MAG: metalloregulator ArsR/SmtB family transcription factor [Paludibacter sp.]|nr:metalloregulator ArsR/SmtB family transcription factor [Paludibacter sp.]
MKIRMETIKNKEYTIDQEQLARFAKAMGHPARITILHFLASMDSCYFGEIHNELPIAKATVSQHLKELKDAGLIQGEIETPKVKYCINRENWVKAQAFFEGFFADCEPKTECCKNP